MLDDPGLCAEVLGATLVAVAFTFFSWRARVKATGAAAVLLGIGMVFGGLAGVLAGTAHDRGSRWRWLLSAIPALMLATHAAFLHYVRGRVIPVASAKNKKRSVDLLGDSETALVAYRTTISAGQRYFSVEALLLRYVIPALLILFITLAFSNQLVKSSALDQFYRSCQGSHSDVMCAVLGEAVRGADAYAKPRDVVYLHPSIVIGAACGLVGAYCYVLLYLGRRAFRLDITPGAATWCMVTLAVGPTLAGFLGYYVLDTQDLWASAGKLERVSVLFLAGFSPRLVVTFLNELAVRLFGEGRSSRSLPARTIPLNQVRGITRDIEERLSEEGVDDATQLAMADPYRLLRNTNFDKRQILRWIDGALLLIHLPETAAALERRGIIGAMSLTWFVRSPEHATELDRIAADVRLDPAGLRGVAQRLSTDQQVQLVQLLYELDTEGAPDIADLGEPNADG
jgi:MFS family permease